jgi:tRNA(Ile)-lysidine synthase
LKLKNKVAYYIIAVSGGPDSMCLLNKYKHRDICVCHVNYLKRESSNRDEEIVRNYCLKNNIKLEVLRVSEEMYRDYKKMYGNNFECVARNIRYDFFITNLKKYNAKYILVGHNYNDHLETAYSMMEKKSKALYYGIMQVSGRKDTIILRPIMNMYKADTEKYCKKHNVPYGIDETNFDPKYTRNRIRQMMSN